MQLTSQRTHTCIIIFVIGLFSSLRISSCDGALHISTPFIHVLCFLLDLSAYIIVKYRLVVDVVDVAEAFFCPDDDVVALDRMGALLVINGSLNDLVVLAKVVCTVVSLLTLSILL